MGVLRQVLDEAVEFDGQIVHVDGCSACSAATGTR
jgi:hypothetical protein